MIVYAKTRWRVTVICLGAGILALIVTHLGWAGVVLALLALVPIVVVHRMRLSADGSRVRVVNLRRSPQLPWSEISDFRMGRAAFSTCLDVCMRDGTRAHAWVVTTMGAAGYSQSKVEAIVSDLRERLIVATGESQEDLDARALADALAAADRGEHAQASALVAEGRVNARVMAGTLIEHAQRARPNRDP